MHLVITNHLNWHTVTVPLAGVTVSTSICYHFLTTVFPTGHKGSKCSSMTITAHAPTSAACSQCCTY